MENFVYEVWKLINDRANAETALAKAIRAKMAPEVIARCDVLDKRATAIAARQEADTAVRRAERAEAEAAAAESRSAG